MKRFLSFLCIVLTSFTFAQEEEEVHSIFFEFDKYNLKELQADAVVGFVSKIDTSRIASVQIYGYCDDRGKDAYNFKLSQNRANTIQEEFIKNGITNPPANIPVI